MRFLLRSTRILLPAALLPALAWSQEVAFGPTLTGIVSSGEGVARTCLQSEYFLGLGARLKTPVFTRWTTVQVAGRGYWISRGSDCVDGFPPPDGTYMQDDRINLLSRPFVTTDVRLAARLGEAPMTLAAGVGNTWHEGYNLPYLVFAAALPVVTHPEFRLGLEGEFQWLRVSADRYRRTYQDMSLIAEEPLGRVRTWSHALILGISLGIPLR